MNPFEPTADARVAAKQLWDVFSALVAQGFSVDQAMAIVLEIVSK